MPAKSRSPFEPFATVVAICAGLYVAGLAFSLVSAVLGRGHLYGLGEQTICVRDDGYSFGVSGGLPPSFKPGVAVFPVAISLCTNHVTLGQQVLDTLTHVPTFLLYGGALLLLWWLLNGAKHNGPFNAANGTRVRLTGWWLVLGGIVATSVETLAHNLLIGTMMASPEAPSRWNQLPGIPASTVLTGLGLIVVARILQVGAQMQDDLAGTV
ncbi:MAG: hypothetical protein JWN00_3736 [Actinomycetia bacterium]|nr:hypothetical protein [Actinomycetes bacterium]